MVGGKNLGRRERIKIYGKTWVYAKRDRYGRFKDIQSIRRSAILDLRKVAKKEKRKRKH